MKRRFTSLLVALAATLAGALPAWAQFDAEANGFDPSTKLIVKASQLSSPASDKDEGQHIEYLIDDDINTYWHSDWHGEYGGQHYVQIDLVEETTGYYQLVFGRRTNSNTGQATQMLVQQSLDGVTYEDVKTLDLEYNGDDDMGKYVISGFFRLNGARHLRLTAVKCNTEWAMWHCAEMQIYKGDEDAALDGAIDDLLVRYDNYLPYGPNDLTDMIGDEFGKYADTEAWEAFKTDMKTAQDYADILLDGGTVSKADIKAIVEKVDADYRAIIASYVTFHMADGYYRIVGALPFYTEKENGETDFDGNPVMTKSYYNIAMFSSLDGWCWWGAKDDTDARQLWKLSMVGKDIKMVNAATGMQCTGLQGEGAIGMSLDVDTLMGFDYVGTENGHDIFYIRYASSRPDYEATASTYFHQWGHEKGAGVGPHKLCLWQATWNKGEAYDGDKGTSEWYIEAVTEDEAKELLDAFDLVKNHDKLVLNYQHKVAEAETLIETAKDRYNTWAPDKENPVITSTSQFHSLWTEPNEGSLDNLLDGDPNTFWHSIWSDGKATGPHQASLDVTVAEPLIGNYQLYVLRRNTDDSHITRVSLYGTNDDAALEETGDEHWTLINPSVELPYVNDQKESTTKPFAITEPFKHLRFYEEDGNGKHNYGYPNFGHYATFQLYPSSKIKLSQYDTMGEVMTTLEQIVAAYPSLDMEALTVEQYNVLVEAYDAVAARYVDPTELRNAIADNSKYADYVLVGENPGYWTSDETATALEKVIADAQTYDDAAVYTQAQSDLYVSDINAARENIFAAARGVDTGKWYHLQVDSEENYEAHGWTKYNVPNGTLYNQRLAAGVRPVWNEEGTVLADNDIKAGCELFYFSEEQMTNEHASQFRFVPLNDSTYAIQNRASGLFIHRNVQSQSGGISLQWTPAAFTVKPIGYGQNVLYMTAIDGTQVTYPHLNAWEAVTSMLGTWDDSNPGCNSAFLIMPVEDIDLDEYAPEKVVARKRGEITPSCFPYDVTPGSGVVYEPVGCFKQDGKSFLGLVNTTEPIQAGTPFFMIVEGEYDGTTTEDISFTLGSGMASEPKSQAGVYGTFVDTKIGSGNVAFTGNESKGVEDEEFTVAAGTGYLKYGEVAMPEGATYDLAIEIDGQFDDWTSISNAIQTVAKRGDIYNMNGQIIRQNASLNDVKSLGRGIYILNGVKVLVK